MNPLNVPKYSCCIDGCLYERAVMNSYLSHHNSGEVRDSLDVLLKPLGILFQGVEFGISCVNDLRDGLLLSGRFGLSIVEAKELWNGIHPQIHYFVERRTYASDDEKGMKIIADFMYNVPKSFETVYAWNIFFELHSSKPWSEEVIVLSDGEWFDVSAHDIHRAIHELKGKN